MKIIITMPITHSFSIAIMETEKIPEVNKIIVEYGDSAVRSSSHLLFHTQPVNLTDVVEDLTFFKLTCENEKAMTQQLNEIIAKLEDVTCDYSLRNEDTGKMVKTIDSVAALDIKFDNLNIIKEGTYKRIDGLKNIQNEFGFTKGYKPTFRPMESQSIEDMEVKQESIYLFAHSKENLTKLKDYLSGQIMEINSDFELGFRIFK